MKIGVFVGSFNPVHKGHIKVVNTLLDGNYVDKVLIIPTNNYWNKTDIIDLKDRINMLLNYQNEKIIIYNELNDLPYTYQIMEELKKRYPNDELALIIGADNIVSFDKWVNYKDLLKYHLIIGKRGDVDIKSYLDKYDKNDKYDIVDIPSDDNISSTLVRENIDNVDLLKKYLDESVIKYIIDNNLYK